MFGLVSSRYLVIAGIAWGVFYVRQSDSLAARKIQQRPPRMQDYRREIGYSILTFCVFATAAVAVFTDPLRQYTRLYTNIADYGWPYFIASVVAIILLHDAYFYFAHRAMHHPKIYRLFHRTHHRSTNPTPWAAFAFNPLEALVEAAPIVFFVCLFPVHPLAILTWLLFMTVYNVYGHLGWELYPLNAPHHPILKWLNTSVSHNQHHQFAHSNYGLYFTWWDRWFGTLHPDYATQFDEVARRN